MTVAKHEPAAEPGGKHSAPETAESTRCPKHAAPEAEASTEPRGKHAAPDGGAAEPRDRHAEQEKPAKKTAPVRKRRAPEAARPPRRRREEEPAREKRAESAAPAKPKREKPVDLKKKKAAPEAETVPKTKAAVPAEEPKGEKAPKKPEGEKAPKKPEGEKAPKKPEGEKAPKKPEGEKTPKKPEGEKTPKKPEGEKTPKKPEGEKTPKKPEGEKAPKKPEGEKAPKKPEGEKAEKAPAKKRRARSIEDYLDAEPAKSAVKPKRLSRRARKRQKALRSAAIIVGSLLLALLCGALYAGSCVSTSDTNLPNVYLDGIAVGGLTKEETAALLTEQGWDQESQRPLTVELPAGVALEIDRGKAGAALPLQKAVNAAFAYGHSGSWLGDLACWLRTSASPVNLGNFTVSLDERYLNDAVAEGLAAFAEATGAGEAYTVDKENERLVMCKGAGAITLDAGKLSAAVREALLEKRDSLRFEELENLPEAPNFEEIYRELAIDPQDAYFTEDWEVVDEVVGCTFGVEQALSIWNETPWLEPVYIPLSITYPEKTGEGLRALLFRDKLGEQTSYFPNSIQNRISNIQLAASKLDGIVLKPGEIFSYNETLGQRTEENGFLLAGAYSNGEVVEEVGGGICQVSSTLYCSVLYAQLGIRSRDSHYFKVDYLPWGQDATVSWPSPDFKFENTREYPIRIHAVADPIERFITIEIWGTDTLGTHIELFEDRYTIYDETWGVATGWNVYLFARVLDADGNLLETRELPVSTYHRHDEDIEWPAAKFEQEAESIQIG